MKTSSNIFIALLLTFFTLLCFHNHFVQRVLILSFDITTEKAFPAQVFWTNEPDVYFSEQRSVTKNVNKGTHNIKIKLPTEYVYKLRIDFGFAPGHITIKNISLRGDKYVRLNTKEFLYNQIIDRNITDEEISFNAPYPDPYIVYEPVLDINARTFVNWPLLILATVLTFLLFYQILSVKIHAKTPDLVFVVAFCILLCLPAMKISGGDTLIENRPPNPAPYLFTDGKLNSELSSQFEKWFSDRFFGRKQLINIYNTIGRINLHPRNEHAIQGDDNWLFLTQGHSLDNYINNQYHSAQDFQKALNYLMQINEWCKANNKEFVYVLIPDKNKIYSQYFPKYVHKRYPDEQSIGNQFVNYIKQNSDIKVIYPYQELINAAKNKDLLYYKTDTHWNKLGAYVAFTKIYKELFHTEFNNSLYIKGWEKTSHFDGDLLKMLPSVSKTPYMQDKYWSPIFFNQIDVQFTQNDYSGEIFLETNNPTAQRSIYFFHDSFFEYIQPYFSVVCNKVNGTWRYNIDKYDLDKIKQQNYDTVIFINVERFIGDLFFQQFPKE